ncbi:hypothetical protein J1605_022572 [Eschrichtius robustus]|uniref:Uncharacterized protein n=1 Tax=Eschrichtius robustus TaxID=9764 RepID=A0AB34HAE8_ESCRO|nr:hypothetical protein J1605_022572 [Eschrichtius robustus]
MPVQQTARNKGLQPRSNEEHRKPRKMTLSAGSSESLQKGFPGGAAVENPPANAGDTGSSPGPGRSHMPRSNWACEPQLLSLRVWSLCSATREAATPQPPARRSVQAWSSMPHPEQPSSPSDPATLGCIWSPVRVLRPTGPLAVDFHRTCLLCFCWFRLRTS